MVGEASRIPLRIQDTQGYVPMRPSDKYYPITTPISMLPIVLSTMERQYS